MITEDQEQQDLANYLDLTGLLWCHVPNGGMRNKAVAGKLKAQGVKSGVPDVLVFSPPPNFPGSRGVAIELKRVKGGTLSTEQKNWLDNLANLGWIAQCCNGCGDAIDLLRELGYR